MIREGSQRDVDVEEERGMKLLGRQCYENGRRIDASFARVDRGMKGVGHEELDKSEDSLVSQ